MAKQILTEIDIDAPIAAVWAVLEDIQNWPEWNRAFSFRKADFRPRGRATLMAGLGSASLPLPVRFEVIDKQKELRWHGGKKGLAYGSHYLKLQSLDQTRTRLIHGEEFSGAIVQLSWPLLKKPLPAAYKAFNRALKKRLTQ